MVKTPKPGSTPKRVVRIDIHEEKEVIWFPENLVDEIKTKWPAEMRREIGFQLGRLQQELDPDHFREMPSIGPGVREIKIQDESKSQYRLIYLAKFTEAIYAFHVITKKTTEKTATADIQIAKKRYSEIIGNRNQSKKP